MSHYDQCRAMIERLNSIDNWRLDASAIDEYAVNIIRLVKEQISDDILQVRVKQYHNDRMLVQALLDPDDPHHSEGWDKIFKEITKVVYWRMGSKENVLLEADDLIQIANIAIIKSVRTFQFNSSFSTWLTKVVVNSIRQAKRDGSAKGRNMRKDQLDDTFTAQSSQQPAEQVEEHALIELIRRVLLQHPDKRLEQIFVMSEVDGWNKAEIGRMLHLSASRIRALLSQAKDILRKDYAIQAWISSTEKRTPSVDTGESYADF